MNINFNNCRLQHFREFQNLKKALLSIPNDYLFSTAESKNIPDIIEQLDFSMFAIMASHIPDYKDFMDLSEHLKDEQKFDISPY